MQMMGRGKSHSKRPGRAASTASIAKRTTSRKCDQQQSCLGDDVEIECRGDMHVDGPSVSGDSMADTPASKPGHVISSAQGIQWTRSTTKTYRARYPNELSKRGNCRGALEDETGESSPAVKLLGVRDLDAVHVDVYAATSDGHPHPYFFCKTAGRDAPTCCHMVDLRNGCRALRFTARRSQDFLCDLSHVGIVRLRKEAAKHGSSNDLANSQTNYFHLKVIPRIQMAASAPKAILSEAIKCISSTQAVSNPVVTQILPLMGPDPYAPEVVLLGKDFGPKTCFRVFQEYQGRRGMWQVTIRPDQYTSLCSHGCTVRLKVPRPPFEQLKFSKHGEPFVFIDAGSETVRRPIKSIPLDKNKAVMLWYPKEIPRSSVSSGGGGGGAAASTVSSGLTPTSPIHRSAYSGASSPASVQQKVPTGLLGQSNNLIAQLLPSDSHIDIGLPQPKRKPLSDGVDQFPATIPMSLSEYQAAAIISQAALSAQAQIGTGFGNVPPPGMVLSPVSNQLAVPSLSLDFTTNSMNTTAASRVDTIWSGRTIASPAAAAAAAAAAHNSWPIVPASTATTLEESLRRTSISESLSECDELTEMHRGLELSPREKILNSMMWKPGTA